MQPHGSMWMNGANVALLVTAVYRFVHSLVLIQTTLQQRDNAQATLGVNLGSVTLVLVVSRKLSHVTY